MIIRNFDYFWNCKIIRDILKNHENIPLSLQNFVLSQHEKDVLTAFEDLIKFSRQSIVKNKWNVMPSTLQSYTNIIHGNTRLINWVLLLHDIAKDRGFPNPHPEYSFQIVHQYKNEIQTVTRLNDDEWRILEWLIHYHDVMGNINTGERAPRVLKKITETLSAEFQKHALEQLALITLCDVQGTNNGMYLTDEKARFWLDLSDFHFLAELENNLLNHRLERWTGNLLTEPHPERKQQMINLIEENQKEPLFKRFWGDQISLVVHGIYLFIELAETELMLLYRLLERIAQFCETAFENAQNIQIIFKPYKPWQQNDRLIFEAYRHKICTDTLTLKKESQTVRLWIG